MTAPRLVKRSPRFWVHPNNAHEVRPNDVVPSGCVEVVSAESRDIDVARLEQAVLDEESRVKDFAQKWLTLAERVGRLEAVVAAAGAVRAYASCWVAPGKLNKVPVSGCVCPPCTTASAFDAAMEEVGRP